MGYIGLILLVIGYIFYFFKRETEFLVINILGSIFLAMQGVFDNTLYFALSNGFIAIILFITLNKKL